MNALKIHLVVLPSLVGIADNGHIARTVKRCVKILIKDVVGIGKVSGLTCLDQSFIGLLHGGPAGRDDRAQLVLFAHVAIDNSSQGIALLIELHHIQEFIPLVVDIHLAGKLERCALLQRRHVME